MGGKDERAGHVGAASESGGEPEDTADRARLSAFLRRAEAADEAELDRIADRMEAELSRRLAGPGLDDPKT